MIKEATRRGLEADNNEASIDSLEAFYDDMRGTEKPFWADAHGPHLKRINITHRANLYRKDPIYYAEFYQDTKSESNKPCCDKCLYYWVTHATR